MDTKVGMFILCLFTLLVLGMFVFAYIKYTEQQSTEDGLTVLLITSPV